MYEKVKQQRNCEVERFENKLFNGGIGFLAMYGNKNGRQFCSEAKRYTDLN